VTARSRRIGMPATLWLHEFGALVWSAFGHPPYLVGSALLQMMGKSDREPNDIDVRVILPDDEYAAWGLGNPSSPHQNAKWCSLVMAYSELGARMTGLHIDFQIQQQTEANKDKGPRSGLGITAVRDHS
jgi:hypothetical protein